MTVRMTLICLFLFAAPASLPAQEKPALTAEQAWQRLKDGNQRFAADMLAKKDIGVQRRKDLIKGQKPFAIVLCCADSRVPPELVFDQGLGDIFVVRVAGNISEPFAIGSIEYAVEHLHAPLIVVLGHEGCGAVKAALGKGKPAGNLGKVIGEVNVGKDLPDDKGAAATKAVINNADYQAKLLAQRSDVIARALEQKTVRVVSGVYQLGSGKVEWQTAK